MNTLHRLQLRFSFGFVMLILTLALAPAASAHVPIGAGGNESLATARPISDPLKSWAIYGDLLGGGQSQYYTFQIAQGQAIHLSLLTTTDPADAAFAPQAVLLGPGLPSQGQLPGGVQAPAGAGWVVINSARPAHATYEAFGPGSYVQLAELTLPAPASGAYYVAVQAAERGGHYGLALGDNESFTPAEWLSNPFSMFTVFAWERQNLALALLPAALVLVVGLGLLARRASAPAKRQRLDLAGWLAALAGLLFLGSGATVLSQMLLAVSHAPVDGELIITLIFAGLPIALGALALWLALGQGQRRARTRVLLMLLAGGGLLFWAGYWLGPALALAAALAPGRKAQPGADTAGTR